jgi:hypothetical protein
VRSVNSKWVAGAAFAVLVSGIVFAGGPGSLQGGALFAPAAQAQNLGQRVVTGNVLDTNSAPLAGATVFLKDLKTKSIRSYSSTSDGVFRFVQVNMVNDQELWAEKDGKKSAVKTISSWDTRKEFACELKLK